MRATCLLGLGHCAFTTDSYVVAALVLPWGDIGRLAVMRHRQRPGDGGRMPALPSRLDLILEEGPGDGHSSAT